MNKVKQKKHLGKHFLNDENVALSITDLLSEEARKVVEIGPGEIFGEVGRVINSPRTVTAKAKTDCVVYEIDWANLQKKLDEAAPVLVAITRGLSLRIGDANELAEKLWLELSVYKSLE